MQEVGEASPASGMRKRDDSEIVFSDDAVSPGLMWLVEERHISKTVIVISGTLAHPTSHVDLLHLTVYAFMHYVFGHTNRQLVFADLQGKYIDIPLRISLVDLLSNIQLLLPPSRISMGRRSMGCSSSTP